MLNDVLQSPDPIHRDSVANEIVERMDSGLLVLSHASKPAYRRVLYVNSYGGREIWEIIKQGTCPTHHLWGCVELVRMGYEVALAAPLPDFYFNHKALPHDFALLKMIRSWLGKN